MPRKVFVAGEILTAADVNTNLMDQAVMSFAGTAARGSAIPSPTEGMVTYLEDTDDLQVYTTAWENVSQPGILQVVQTVKSDTFSTTSQTMTDLTGLSATITPRSTSSKIMVAVSIGALDNSTTNTYGWQIVRGSTAIGIGDAAGNRQRTTVGGNGEVERNQPATMVFLDSPSTTSSTTYKVQIRGASQTVYVNRQNTDDDQTYRFRAVSTITLIEVAG